MDGNLEQMAIAASTNVKISLNGYQYSNAGGCDQLRFMRFFYVYLLTDDFENNSVKM
ncbi:MAG: hypothetical protein VKK42_13595 [Lyngbya sp.]|nr:hypothetical protein [Lyngbya sp.]